MSGNNHNTSAYARARVQERAAANKDERSMDELLASIQEILLENKQQIADSSQMALSLPAPAPAQPLTPPEAEIAIVESLRLDARLIAADHDDVLEELLMPIAAPQSPEAVPPALPPPSAVQELSQPDVTASAPEIIEVAPACPPLDELQAAADVLGALAAGLAAAQPVVEQAPGEAVQRLSPTAAAATAVAEVAAAVARIPDRGHQPEALQAPIDESAAASTSVSLGTLVGHPDVSDEALATLLRPVLLEWLDANMPRIVDMMTNSEALRGGVSTRACESASDGTAKPAPQNVAA